MNFPDDYNRAPLLLIWEMTRSCALVCRHCRAEATDRRDPRELSREEGKRLIDDVASMGTPLIIFTGGDPLQRDDLEECIRHAGAAGLRTGAIPATTDRLTRDRVRSLKHAGLDQMAVSIDGPDAHSHDDFRRVEGSFEKAMAGAAWAREFGLPLQVNTVFGAWNADGFDAMAELVTSLGVVFWEVFFLVPTGRGATLSSCTADEIEALFEKLHRLSARVPFRVKVTEAQHYRRYRAQHGGSHHPGNHGAPDRPVNAGNGFCFVDHVGDVYPSGFLPIVCGNVRRQSVIDIYRHASVFRDLRDEKRLQSKCGVCEYRSLCGGGSRARAYAMTGDYLAEEPFCAHEPVSIRPLK